MICLLSAIISKFLSFTFLSFTFQYVSEPIKGEGIHHIAFEVEDIQFEITRLKKEGFVVLNEVPQKGADNKLVAFLHPKTTNGVLIELCQEIQ